VYRIVCSKNSIRRIASIALVAALVFALPSCKDTDVLTQLIQDQVYGEIDFNAKPLVNEKEDSEEDPSRRSLTIEEYAENAQVTVGAFTFSETPNADGTTDQHIQDEDSDYTYSATDGSEASDTKDGNAKDGDQADGTNGTDGKKSDPSKGEKSDTNAPETPGSEDGIRDGDGDDPKEQDPGDGDPGGTDGTGGYGGDGKVYNDDKYTELPRGVRTVAAVGDYALLVQMLAGKGALVAADATWLGKVRASSAFPNEGLERVVTAWRGDGKTAGSANVDAIINARPNAVLVGNNTSTLTQAECDRITKAGIHVVIMPAIGILSTLDADLITAVQVVGVLLKDVKNSSDPFNRTALSMADEYIRRHDGAINDTLKSNDGYTIVLPNTVHSGGIMQNRTSYYPTSVTWVSPNRYYADFIDSWETVSATALKRRIYHWGYLSDANYAIATNLGLYIDPPIDEVFPYESVKIDGYGYSRPGEQNEHSYFSLCSYYFQCAGIMVAGTGIGGSGTADAFKKRLATQFFWGYTTDDDDILDNLITEEYADASKDYYFRSSLMVYRGYTTDSTRYTPFTRLGHTKYPAVLTRDAAIAQNFVNNANDPNGFYNMRQPFQAWVVPSGLAGNWMDGNIESFLIVPWAYCMYQQNKNLSGANDYINDFYKTFYRCGAANIVTGYGEVYTAMCPSP
jgi:hypothetical protein